MSALFVEQVKWKPNCRLQKQVSCSRNLFSLLCISFSITLLTFDKREIGLWLLRRSLDSFLKTGTTLAVFKANGKIPWAKDLFINSESRRDIIF